MKKNYKLNEEQSVQKFTLLSSTIIIFIVATVLGLILIQTEFDNFKRHIQNFETALIEQEKFNIKTSVENLKNDINFDELSILNTKKQRIKSQSIIAYNLAYSLYLQSTHLSKQKQIELIKFSINDISQKRNDINYFILDTNGVLILNSENHNDENENFIDFKDINGNIIDHIDHTREILKKNPFVEVHVGTDSQSLAKKLSVQLKYFWKNL